MAKKKRSWFGRWTRLFIYDRKQRTAVQESKRWRCGGFGRVKLKHFPASLPAPMNPIDEATEKQKNYALTVALATATAAEAAVAAAQAAAEVVRLTAGTSRSYFLCSKEQRNLAATKIQSSFRAYIARKALRALKGLVKLQALIRGDAVRHRLVYKSKSVQSNAIKMRTTASLDENKQFVDVKMERKESRSKLEHSSERNNSSTTHPKEDTKAARFKKQEAIHKRGCTTEYSFSRREKRNMKTSEETLSVLDRQGQWLQQWAHKELHRREGLENLRPIAVRKSKNNDVGEAEVKSRYHTRKQDSVEVLSSPMSLARRSFCHTRKSFTGEERSVPNSPVVFPTYMATTQSAKAKARSTSTPRQRVGLHNVCIDHGLYHKNGISFWSLQDGELFAGHDTKTS